ncbi:MAG: Triosephosphate isomerase [Candidatus Amesbacteria bacterium GW2011_GWA2_42_12]|uniref:Triosephosphate isomerase n=1 Tax=Candidatus Amesbacteria bacterium GW2011_GWA2_42_12 TaxID=1618356 RepID=A0A0G0Y7N0_9BACT|nr:MAG: Triosephosphate isomerase [Candidatus Amesbacteria bacterium GW2011_GWA2_42_12]
MIAVNFKKYINGNKAVDLAKICKKVADETGVKIIVAVQVEDLESCLETGIECWSQKPEDAKYNFSGTLLNHSDYPLTDEVLNAQCSVLNIIKCVCISNISQAAKLANLTINYIAFEPHELIGNTEKSVSSEKPEDIQRLASSVQCPVLVGAGVHSAEDVKIALKMGAKGILVATDVVKASDPEKELRELAEAF